MPILTRRGAARLGVLFGFLIVLLIFGWTIMFRMPGESFSGPLPGPRDRETTLAEVLRQDVVALAESIGERNLTEPQALTRAARFIEQELAQAGYAVERQTYDVDGQEVSNLEVELPGSRRPKEIVVVGAHYDTIPGCPGANDNATGVAAVLALARALGDRRIDRTLRFVLFVNEEPPYFQTDRMGSLVYPRRCRERNEDIRAMVCLETLGYYSDRPGSQDYPPLVGSMFPSTGNFVAFVGNLGSRGLVKNAIQSFRDAGRFPSEGAALPGWMPGIGWSDHWAFWKAGYDAIMVTDTAPYRYADYHRLTDTVDKIDFDRLGRVVAGLESVVLELTHAD